MPVCGGNEAEKIFTIDEKDSKAINYLRQVSENSDMNLFMSPWGGVLLKNCDAEGNLLEFNSISEYEKVLREGKISNMWLYLPLKVFSYSNMQLFGIFVCPECPVMSSIEGLEPSQDQETIKSHLCMHSCVASMLVKDWRSEWEVRAQFDLSYIRVGHNQDSNFIKFIPQTSASPFLAAVLDKDKVSLLFCATARQETPFCSKCVRRKCHHFLKLKAFYETSIGHETESVDSDSDVDNYEPLPDVGEDDSSFNDNYTTNPPNHIRGRLYGYNFQNIVYPFRDSPHQQRVLHERISGIVNIPDCLVPRFDPDLKCKHNLPFKSCDKELIRQSKNLCLFNEIGQRIFKTEVFARPSDGPCKCLQRMDGHEFMIWNLGGGSFVDYTWLLSYLQKWRVSGLSMHALLCIGVLLTWQK